METNYFELYKEWMESGRIDAHCSGGLCDTSAAGEEFSLMKPDRISNAEHFFECPASGGYWGYDGDPLSSSCGIHRDAKKRGATVEQAKFDFTPMRQTIVLFCAAMADQIP